MVSSTEINNIQLLKHTINDKNNYVCIFDYIYNKPTPLSYFRFECCMQMWKFKFNYLK